MPSNSETSDKIQKLMYQSLLAITELINNDPKYEIDHNQVISIFLQGVISTSIDFAELQTPGIAPVLYSEIEACAKLGGIRAVEMMQYERRTPAYVASEILPHDIEAGMNYLGQKLSTTLFKSIHELPKPLRNREMLLRAVEALLTNLLNQKFENSHDILDSLCEHVHMALSDMATNKFHILPQD
jgi:hypothetical protein